MINQNFYVVPQGLIESGTVQVQADPVTGLISAQESIVAGVSIFSQTIQDSSEVKIDPAMLLSKSLKVGMKWTVGIVALSIASIVGKAATANITINDTDKNLTGTATIDLSGQYISITHVLLSGVVSSENVVIELVPA